jgi:uncharacterized OsmC-like protein
MPSNIPLHPLPRVLYAPAAARGILREIRDTGGKPMDGEQLRTLQAPLKQRYRETPDAARVPARAEARLDTDDVACTVASWHGETHAGLHPATGGSGDLACSADMLLEAVVACAGVTLRAVATAMGVTVRSGRVIAEGNWDARGTLGIDRSVPVGLSDISLRFEIDSDADPTKLERMIQTTERYCVILQTLRNPPRITVA